MGGRIASQVAGKGQGIDALALFVYPLHPPWNRSQRRDLNFPDIKCPTLFCSGIRDEFATPRAVINSDRRCRWGRPEATGWRRPRVHHAQAQRTDSRAGLEGGGGRDDPLAICMK